MAAILLIYSNENCCLLILIILNVVSNVAVENKPALLLTMDWRRPLDKSLYEPMTAHMRHSGSNGENP